MTLAAKLTSADFAAVLNCRPPFVAVRLWAIDLGQYCSRCGGSGHYSRNAMGSTTCYACGGAKYVLPRLTEKLLEQVKAAVAEGKLEPYLEKCRRRTAAKKIVAAAEKRVIDELYGNPLNIAINAACARKGKTHWSAMYQLRMEALGLPKMCDDLTGSVACSSQIKSIAAGLLDRAYKLDAEKPELVEQWVADFEATKVEVLRIAQEGLALFATEAWWN